MVCDYLASKDFTLLLIEPLTSQNPLPSQNQGSRQLILFSKPSAIKNGYYIIDIVASLKNVSLYESAPPFTTGHCRFALYPVVCFCLPVRSRLLLLLKRVLILIRSLRVTVRGNFIWEERSLPSWVPAGPAGSTATAGSRKKIPTWLLASFHSRPPAG